VGGISGICDVAVGALTAKHALLWQNGGIVDLGSLGGQGWNTPMAINNRGRIVGFSDLSGDLTSGQLTANFHAFIWTKEAGRMIDLGTLPGDSLSEALDINDENQVVGVSFPSAHAFIWQNGVMKDLNSVIPSNSPLLLLEASSITAAKSPDKRASSPTAGAPSAPTRRRSSPCRRRKERSRTHKTGGPM